LWPFVENNGQMVNLDPNADFTAVVPVQSGQTGAYNGQFSKALVDTDANNIAPRVAFAWRAKPGTIVRGGYGISYNSGSYSTIARQMTAQPPFAVANTSVGTVIVPLRLSNPFVNAAAATLTNNYGVQKDYGLGLVQSWNLDLSRDVRQVWNTGVNYTFTRGSSLDIVRAPNRDPSGLRIEGVQPFLWQTSEGASRLNAAAFRVSRRPVKGIGGSLSYTLAKSRDNASSMGGATVVAQNDQDLNGEWGLSSFDRRHQLTADLNVELPFGPNRKWLSKGGFWTSVLRDWRFTSTITVQTGTPFSPLVQGAATDVARGTNGTLRADYNGQPVQISSPTIDRFFNTTAFTIPATGAFGNATRNMIIGPGSKQVNAQFARDIRLGREHVVSVQWNATNLFNTVNYGSLDTNLNSPTFGQILSARPMRSTQLNLRFRF
jgi:hypothetical protein